MKKKKEEMLLIANWDYAGSNRFALHAVDETRHMATMCGLRLEEPRYRMGDWQYEMGDTPGCLNCVRVLKSIQKENKATPPPDFAPCTDAGVAV